MILKEINIEIIKMSLINESCDLKTVSERYEFAQIIEDDPFTTKNKITFLRFLDID